MVKNLKIPTQSQLHSQWPAQATAPRRQVTLVSKVTVQSRVKYEATYRKELLDISQDFHNQKIPKGRFYNMLIYYIQYSIYLQSYTY